MAIDIEVMYSDEDKPGHFRQVRMPIENAGQLDRTNVLFVILSSDTTVDRARRYVDGRPVERIAEDWGQDITILVRRGRRVLLDHYSDSQWRWIHLDRAFDPAPRHGIPPIFPADSILFFGKMLSTEDWERAVEQFNSEMH